MIVKKDGKEVKNAKVFYSVGSPAYVQVEGVNYDVKSFELVDEEPVKKTADLQKSDKKAVKTTDVKVEEEKEDSAVLTTADVSTRKK